jgi:hypothetical protein
MAPRIHSIVLKRHDKVVANVDLPGVPAGTPGKVLVVSGVTWLRYRVLFENGVEHGLLDGRHIVRPKAFVPLDQRVEEDVAAASDDGAAAAGDGEAAAAADNPYGVPAHLIERSKKARERLAAAG